MQLQKFQRLIICLIQSLRPINNLSVIKGWVKVNSIIKEICRLLLVQKNVRKMSFSSEFSKIVI